MFANRCRDWETSKSVSSSEENDRISVDQLFFAASSCTYPEQFPNPEVSG